MNRQITVNQPHCQDQTNQSGEHCLQVLAPALLHWSDGDHFQQLRSLLLHLREEHHGDLRQRDDRVGVVVPRAVYINSQTLLSTVGWTRCTD